MILFWLSYDFPQLLDMAEYLIVVDDSNCIYVCHAFITFDNNNKYSTPLSYIYDHLTLFNLSSTTVTERKEKNMSKIGFFQVNSVFTVGKKDTQTNNKQVACEEKS